MYRYSSKCFICCNSLNPHNNPVRLGYYLYHFMDEEPEAQRVWDLFRVIHALRDEAGS